MQIRARLDDALKRLERDRGLLDTALRMEEVKREKVERTETLHAVIARIQRFREFEKRASYVG